MNETSASLSDATPTQVLGACPHDCPDTCSMLTTVAGGIAIKVQGNPAHPHTDGALCTKVSRYPERTYHPERLLHPLKRVGPKGSGQFERVSWDSALRDIAARLSAIASRGPDAAQAILPYSYAGTMGLVQGDSLSARFFHHLGASLLERTICASAGGEGLTQSLGGKVGMRVEFFAEAKLILIWGSNSIASNLHFWRYAQVAKRNGARLICIDPRRSETADKCHEHLALLPGTDGALALALMHELITHDWLDHDYLAQHTLGWDLLRARALQWSPERAAQVCGLQAEQIQALARDYGASVASGAPAAIRLNYGMQRVHGGANAVRLIASLPALIGAWRQRAGGVLLSSSGQFPVQQAALQRPDLLAGRTPRTINMSTIGDDLLRPASAAFGPAIEALIVYNSNPVAVAPDSSKVVQGFARDDLFTVVLEHFQTDTADYADYLLPATTQLEHWDVHRSYGHTDVLLNRPAIAPLGEAKPNTQIFRELAQHMGYSEPCLADDDQTLCRQAYGDAVDFELLLAQGFATLATPEAPFATGQFPTPSGKCEFFSARLAAQGLDGLPDHVPNHEAFNSSAQYPLAMISPPARNFLNSSFVNVKSLRDIEGEPLLEMHASDAAARNLKSGAIVRVFNARGVYRCKMEVSKRARPGVVNGLGVWWRKLGLDGTNVNQVTSQALTDLGHAPTFYDCLVQVEADDAAGANGDAPAVAANSPPDELREVLVWDLPVRLFHWTLLALYAAALGTGLSGGSVMRWHEWVGESILVLVSFRILWGFTGSQHARFSDFLQGPKAVLAFVTQLLRREHPSHLGHNPAGGWMVLLFLLLLLAQASAGLFANDDILFEGALYPLIGKDLSDTLTSWHRRVGLYVLPALVLLHVAAVVYHQVALGERLVRAMLTGRKLWPARLAPASRKSSSPWLALGLLIAVALALSRLVF
jgi:anaerobic selenocysteine-containing dehydrogenase/cytochrome b